jgi:hypothetical protein
VYPLAFSKDPTLAAEPSCYVDLVNNQDGTSVPDGLVGFAKFLVCYYFPFFFLKKDSQPCFSLGRPIPAA